MRAKPEEIVSVLREEIQNYDTRVRRDEIGTPLCITVDFQTVGDDKVEADGCVTVRDRDTMEQVRMPISELRDYVAKKVAF